ncbi:terpene synthase family protein [Aspergillus homomorphus CBS 101889]|uniref:Terpene synthase n=1 Tax=Aspergillus homomorphus (strain CBS 101889) TaxID=1450537 RepID=A0A395HVR7_ASPHC|nr:terpenoid synthase [Aspergillus homomorphus CBS 101889]RAL11513.1 terpenoid synthase [Aspergillus homomorphus CBS 101889]
MIEGQTLQVPDLVASLYSEWTVERHPDEEQLRHELEDDFVVRWCPDPEKRRKMRKGDFAQVAGYFWAGSSLERIRPLAEFMYWYFIWDDEIDCGDLQSDKIGKSLQTGHSREALARYAASMYNFVNAVCNVQQQWMTNFPPWEEYMETRMQTVGIYPCLMTMEYAYGLNTPNWVYNHPSIHAMFQETAFSCIIVNDIVSLQKELIAIPTNNTGHRATQIVDQIDSVIPLKMFHGGHRDAQTALNEVLGELKESRVRLDEAERSFLSSAEYCGVEWRQQRDDIAVLIQGCKNAILGNLKWSSVLSEIGLDGCGRLTVD